MSLSFPLAAVMVPEDILTEILVRLPASSLLRFKCVSKLWSSLISSRYFTNLFFKFSSSRRREQRRVFVYWNSCLLFSTSLCNLDSTASFPTLNLDMNFPCNNTNDRLEFVNAVRGLMCFRKEREIQIINFTTRQVLRLPLVESNLFLESDVYDVWNYFGYDPLNDEYKVLNTNRSRSNELRSETQVFVLGDGASWRNTKSLTFSPPPHRPRFGRVISINGVLYYGAFSYEKRMRSVLMSFDFNSEEFNLIEFPMEYHIKLGKEIREVDLIHYQDHVAVLDDSHLYNDSILNLWVLKDTGKNKWSHKVLVLPCRQIRESLELEDMDYLRIRGTGLKGKVTLSGGYVNRNNKGTYDYESREGTYVFYDLENSRITKGCVIDLPWDCGIRLLGTDIWEDVESIMYLEA